MEIVSRLMDDNGSSKDLWDGKALVEERDPGIPLVGEQGKQVPGVVRMRCAVGVKMLPCVLEIISAVPVFMNMHAVKVRGTPLKPVRQSEQLRLNESTAIGGLLKFHHTA